jgi:RHS repeat-associated protein
MTVVNYYTVGGQLLGEQTTGQPPRDYVTDALGSVVGTVTSTGQAENTYRYKPYGALLAKTGTAPDPAFTWVGSQGYRQTGKKYSDVYVRARHYDSTGGRWTSKDPAGRIAGDTPWQYSKQSPTTMTDPTGLIVITPVFSPFRWLVGCNGACGTMFAAWYFDLEHPASEDGYIIQMNTLYKILTHCDGTPFVQPPPAYMWEAFFIKKGQTRYENALNWPNCGTAPLDNTDECSQLTYMEDIKGSIFASSEIRFYPVSVIGVENLMPVWGLLPRGSPFGTDSCLPSTLSRPVWWNTANARIVNGYPPATRGCDVEWSCCNCPSSDFSCASAYPD